MASTRVDLAYGRGGLSPTILHMGNAHKHITCRKDLSQTIPMHSVKDFEPHFRHFLDNKTGLPTFSEPLTSSCEYRRSADAAKRRGLDIPQSDLTSPRTSIAPQMCRTRRNRMS
jgi:hypothetical protein